MEALKVTTVHHRVETSIAQVTGHTGESDQAWTEQKPKQTLLSVSAGPPVVATQEIMLRESRGQSVVLMMARAPTVSSKRRSARRG